MRSVGEALAAAAALMTVACSITASSPSRASPDGASPGFCSANVPPFKACNMLTNVAPLITPTCVDGTMPTGTGGTIVEGTYVLTSSTFYNVSILNCADEHLPVRGTIALSDGCYQAVASDDLQVVGTASVSFVVQGNSFTSMLTCADYVDLDAGGTMFSVHEKTFTATPTTLTIFVPNSAAGNFNPDQVDVFTLQ